MAEETTKCTAHLIALVPGVTPQEFIKDLTNNSTSGSRPYILKGVPHGWVHFPHKHNLDRLLAHKWNVFLLTERSELPDVVQDIVAAHLWVELSITNTQYEDLISHIETPPQPMPSTPSLPSDWNGASGDGGFIPLNAITTQQNIVAPLRPGELKLDTTMADFLTKALPEGVRNKPVSLFNLFKYPKDGDSSVHDHYMEGFKEKFGDAAGARVKFMGPVHSAIHYTSSTEEEEGTGPSMETANGSAAVERKAWHDANLVQYDSIWHYAYMLSTGVYQELNQEKMEGLVDTCILFVSEVEMLE
ncbi:hypothetical protein LTR37_007989 [Vermiconidia calcicola]|uniref:Uncharacterized protein n=1 Tax=Vermiconidia calcicola TaxID=1690605 RepID=A0ACC3NCJ2_9PEZI|nr:hypothetical protein LTR37_007989 [Vermiconidia calcicola]